MSMVPDRYRGKVLYHLVFAELVTAARYRGTVTYQELAQVMGLPLVGNYMGKEIGHILGEIVEDEHRQERPLLSAVAVGVSGVPGPGFYGLAQDLGKLSPGIPDESKREFWEKELAAVYETWKRPLYKAE